MYHTKRDTYLAAGVNNNLLKKFEDWEYSQKMSIWYLWTLHVGN